MNRRIWIARALIAAVIVWNLQAAAAFLAKPASFAPGFELWGVPGEAAVRGIAVLFIMWNIPYLVACWHPIRHRVSLGEALAMQAVGVLGEALILLGLPQGHALLASSLQRFITFDTAGLFLLGAALLITRKPRMPE